MLARQLRDSQLAGRVNDARGNDQIAEVISVAPMPVLSADAEG